MTHKELLKLKTLLNSYFVERDYKVPLVCSVLDSQIEHDSKYGILEDDSLSSLFKKFVDSCNDSELTVDNYYGYILIIDSILNKRKRSISHSEVATFQTCKLKHALKYDARLYRRKNDNFNLQTGSWTHEIIDELYKIEGEAVYDDLEKIIAKYEAEAEELKELFDEEGKEKITIGFANAKALSKAYYRVLYLTERTSGYVVDEGFSEKWFRTPIISSSGKASPKFVYRSVLDQVFTNTNDGLTYLHEIKTKSKYGDAERDYLLLDDQVTSYMWQLLKHGYNVGGIVYTVLRKSGFKQTKKNYYQIKSPGLIYGEEKLKSDANKMLKEAMAEYPDRDFVIEKIEGMETIDELCQRMEDDILANPYRYVFRETIYRTMAQIKGFERKIGVVAKEIAKNTIETAYPQPSGFDMLCGVCDYRDVCKNWYDIPVRDEIIKAQFISKSEIEIQKAEQAIKSNSELLGSF